MTKYALFFRFLSAGLIWALLAPQVFSQGDLEPPTNAIVNGAPVSTMKSLNQIEPRTMITGFPFTVMSPGSYYFSPPPNQPILPVVGTNAITILASNVRLDLNGFPVIGTNSSPYDGIYVPGQCDNISIRNGIILQWGKSGISATMTKSLSLAELKAIGNAQCGFNIGSDSLVERCGAWNNGQDGIQVGGFCTVIDCKSGMNGGAGIHTFQNSRVIGCTATQSTNADGFHMEDLCTIRDCTAAGNYKVGIRVGSLCRVVDNTCAGNGTNCPPGPPRAGISVEGANSVIEGNIVCGNLAGIQIGGVGNLIIHNCMSQNTAGDIVAPPPVQFLYVSNFVGMVSAFTNGAPVGNFSTNNAWANFSFK